jgi:hypothetical protein
VDHPEGVYLPGSLTRFSRQAEVAASAGKATPIEPTVAAVRHRTKVTKGPGSRAAGLTAAVTLIESAQARPRAVNAPRPAAPVGARADFAGGGPVEQPENPRPADAAVREAT